MKGGLRRLDVVKSSREFMRLLSHCKIKLPANLLENKSWEYFDLDMGNRKDYFHWAWMGKCTFQFSKFIAHYPSAQCYYYYFYFFTRSWERNETWVIFKPMAQSGLILRIWESWFDIKTLVWIFKFSSLLLLARLKSTLHLMSIFGVPILNCNTFDISSYNIFLHLILPSFKRILWNN